MFLYHDMIFYFSYTLHFFLNENYLDLLRKYSILLLLYSFKSLITLSLLRVSLLNNKGSYITFISLLLPIPTSQV